MNRTAIRSLTYILDIRGTVIYQARMSAPIKGEAVPDGAVLTVQVRLKDSFRSLDGDLDGMVTRLEFVRCGTDRLPQEWLGRYLRRCW